MKIGEKITILCSVILFLGVSVSFGQSSRSGYSMPDIEAEKCISPKSLELDIEFLSGEFCKGRGSGQPGSAEAAFWISRQFKEAGLEKMGRSWFQSFYSRGRICHNVVGMLPASGNGTTASGKYIIVGAHYDNIGVLDGKTYPGADSNASGVAAMTSLAKMFSDLRARGSILDQNIIFVAFDAKQLSLAGSQELWIRILLGRLANPLTGKAVSRKDISLMVNLDILGGVSSPITAGRPDYLMLLGGDRFYSTLESINRYNNIYLQLRMDYYGSKGFTDMFLNRVSDQKVFRENGILGVMFTSGITMDTNKVTDTADKIDYEILYKRVKLIFHWIERMMFLHK